MTLVTPSFSARFEQRDWPEPTPSGTATAGFSFQDLLDTVGEDLPAAAVDPFERERERERSHEPQGQARRADDPTVVANREGESRLQETTARPAAHKPGEPTSDREQRRADEAGSEGEATVETEAAADPAPTDPAPPAKQHSAVAGEATRPAQSAVASEATQPAQTVTPRPTAPSDGRPAQSPAEVWLGLQHEGAPAPAAGAQLKVAQHAKPDAQVAVGAVRPGQTTETMRAAEPAAALVAGLPQAKAAQVRTGKPDTQAPRPAATPTATKLAPADPPSDATPSERTGQGGRVSTLAAEVVDRTLYSKPTASLAGGTVVRAAVAAGEQPKRQPGAQPDLAAHSKVDVRLPNGSPDLPAAKASSTPVEPFPVVPSSDQLSRFKGVRPSSVQPAKITGDGVPIAAGQPNASAKTLGLAELSGAAEQRGSAGLGAQSSLSGNPAPIGIPTAIQLAAQSPSAMAAVARQAPTGMTAHDQVAVQITRAIGTGKDQVSIKLHPAELGRVEVRMEMSDEGHLRATITAERAETLDLLQRDARSLERALQQAGLKTDQGSLSFSLRGEGGQQHSAGQQTRHDGRANGAAQGPDGETPVGQADARRPSLHDGALDITV